MEIIICKKRRFLKLADCKTFTKFCRKLWQRAVVGLKQTEKIELKMAKGRGARRLGNVDR